jgi:YHS domain-containing protein
MARRTKLSILLLSLGALTAPAGGASAREPEVYTGLFSSLGAGGYDVVAYFTQGRPVEGKASFATSYEGATWRFVSQQDLALFQKNPSAYAPQYGGYCAWAVSQDSTASGDPNVWRIVNGRLYLNYDADVQARWNAGTARFISDADRNWPSVLDK